MSEPREGWLASQFKQWTSHAQQLRDLGFHVTGSMQTTYTKDALDPMVAVTVFDLSIDSNVPKGEPAHLGWGGGTDADQ